jgi:predicted acylesterase/phospholipase RssA
VSAPPSAGGAPQPDPTTEELRLAMALNGGVSLAVWMGGCAVELDRVRRCGETAHADHCRVYDDLSKCLGRRLNVDVLTGTSAGGINAALLGAATAHGRRLEPDFVREKWIELGDLTAMLRDPEEESPTSLMDGGEFYDGLLTTFKALLGSDPDETRRLGQAGPPENRPGSVPLLDVTMTDVVGVERRFRDAWGAELVALDHRPRFRFRKRDHFTAQALAAAARTSASFPVAFDPWRVAGEAKVLAGLPNPTYGIDGGLLDNAPIRDALELLPTRPANSMVRRYFCYVNGDPAVAREETIGSAPTLPQVAGYTVNLPRTAPLVDHLYAIRAAVERPARTEQVQEQLLTMDLKQLEDVAAVLFPSYADRRTLESLEELLPEPRDVLAMQELLQETGGELPWIPRRFAPGAESRWEWGLRPAQRILHLMLDLLRPAIRKATSTEIRTALLETRIAIDAQLATLEGARDEVTQPAAATNPAVFDPSSPAELVNEAAAEATERAPQARQAVAAAAAALGACLKKHSQLFPPGTETQLFGPNSLIHSRQKRLDTLLRRVLSIEVVRRAFATEADIESAARLRFVQLTPEAPAPIFTRDPLNQRRPGSAAEKLTGVGLGHFAGFYRRSWRANDFMWGRLDAAVRIVDLLLDSPTPEVGVGAGASSIEQRVGERAESLSAALLRSAGDDAAWLLGEVLEDDPGAGGDLAVPLRKTISDELRAAETDPAASLPVTRALFQRAAQREVLRDELPVLLEESREDRRRGSAARPLELDGDVREQGANQPGQKIEAEVKAIRAIYRDGSTLPQRLSDPGEAVSDLGLRTIAHAAFVGLAALRTAGLPMAKFLGLARPPLLAVSGSVAPSRFSRLTVILGFWAAAIYLASRVLSTGPGAELKFSSVWSLPSLTALVAALGALGVAGVPGLRAWRHVHILRNVLLAGFLVLAAGGLAAALGIWKGDLDVERVLFAPGAETPPEWALIAVLGTVGILSLARLPLPGPLEWLGGPLDRLRRGRSMRFLLIAAFAILAAFAGQTVVGAIDDGLWQAVVAITALAAAPLGAACAVALWRRTPTAATKRS